MARRAAAFQVGRFERAALPQEAVQRAEPEPRQRAARVVVPGVESEPEAAARVVRPVVFLLFVEEEPEVVVQRAVEMLRAVPPRASWQTLTLGFHLHLLHLGRSEAWSVVVLVAQRAAVFLQAVVQLVAQVVVPGVASEPEVAARVVRQGSLLQVAEESRAVLLGRQLLLLRQQVRLLMILLLVRRHPQGPFSRPRLQAWPHAYQRLSRRDRY